MKVTVEIDCTPAEARHFLGLPDLEPLQRQIMAEVERRTLAEMERFSPETLLKTWFSPDAAAQMQETFRRLFQAGFGAPPSSQAPGGAAGEAAGSQRAGGARPPSPGG